MQTLINLKCKIYSMKRPNFKNLSWAQIRLVPLKIVFNFSIFKPVLNRNRFLGDLRRDLNSLKSDKGFHF